MKRPITIISSISSLLFLVAIIWFGAGIYIDKKSGGEKAQNRYEALLTDTKSALSQSRFGNPDFSNKFIRAIGNIDDFSTLKLEINGELVYSYPPNTFSLPSADLVKHFEEEVFVNQDNHFKLSASLYLMKPNSIYNYARIAFLLILVGTIIVVVLIILTNGTDDAIIRTGNYKFKKRDYSEIYRPFDEEAKEQKTEEPKKSENLDSAKKLSFSEKASEKGSEKKVEKKPIFNPEPEEPKHAPENKEIKSEEISITFPDDYSSSESDDEGGLDIIDQFEQQNAEDDIFSDDFSVNMVEEEPIFEAKPVAEAQISKEEETKAQQIEDESTSQEATPSVNQISADSSAVSPLANPEISHNFPMKNAETEKQKKSSPITGLLVQSELEPSIDEEILNGKQNLTVALIKINSLDRGNSISSQVVDILKQKTASESPEIFEYKSDSYAAVLKDTDLQATVDLFEDIYNKISDFLKDNNSANEVSVGISSVASRKIKAERLLLEASQALDYASGDPDSPIVAFRANPEKYKEMEE